MKAITISQPYASLIASGEKWIENRTWHTSYRGALAIHAGKGTQYMTRKELAAVPHGCIVATARLVECVELSTVRILCGPGAKSDREMHSGRAWTEIRDHKHAEGPWLWILSDIVALPEPIPFCGAQGLWDWNQ